MEIQLNLAELHSIYVGLTVYPAVCSPIEAKKNKSNQGRRMKGGYICTYIYIPWHTRRMRDFSLMRNNDNLTIGKGPQRRIRKSE